MVDIDINDEYTELIIEGSRSGGNQHISITRIINGKLITQGNIEGTLMVNNQLGYLVQKNLVLLFGTNPISFISTMEQMISFIPSESSNTQLDSYIRIFKAGTKFTIYSCDTDNNWNVEINGVKGIMNLQVVG